MKKLLVIVYMDDKRDVLELETTNRIIEKRQFVADNILHVRARFSAAHEFEWHYFPLCNVKHYNTQSGETA